MVKEEKEESQFSKIVGYIFIAAIIIGFMALGDCAGVGGELWKPDY